jgi:hypothetical protein
VAAGEEFEVLDSVVRLDTVDVMDGFLGSEFPADRLLHHVAVFEDLVPRFAVTSGDSKDGVPTLNSPRHLRETIFLAVFLTYEFISALWRASCTFVVQVSTWPARSVSKFSAVLAMVFGPFLGIFSSTSVRTGHGAVERVFAELLSVGCQVRRFVEEWLSAIFAFELNGFFATGGATVNRFVRILTGFVAKAAGGIARFDAKRFCTLRANLLNRHLGYSEVGGTASSYHGCLVM